MIDKETGVITDDTEETETLPAIQWFGALISQVGMQFPPETTQEDWELQGSQIGLYERGRLWAIGDWLNFGERRWGEMYAQGIELFHLDKQTLMNVKSVALRFPIEQRFTNLSWSHHATVAGIEDPEERKAWLIRAAENHWSREELRAAIKGGVTDAKQDIVLPPAGESEEIPFTDESDDEESPLEKAWVLVFNATKEPNITTLKSLLLQALDLIEPLLPKRS